MDFLAQIAAFVTNSLPAQASIAGIVLEMILRMWPSEKPKSILLMISSMIHMMASIFSGMASFLDKIIPQNLK